MPVTEARMTFLRSAMDLVGPRCLRDVLGYPCARRRWHSGGCEVSHADAVRFREEMDTLIPSHVGSGKTHAAAKELARTTDMTYEEAYAKLRAMQDEWNRVRRSRERGVR